MGSDTWRQSLRKETGECGPGWASPEPQVRLPDESVCPWLPTGKTHTCRDVITGQGLRCGWRVVTGDADLLSLCLWGRQEVSISREMGAGPPPSPSSALWAPWQEFLLF